MTRRGPANGPRPVLYPTRHFGMFGVGIPVGIYFAMGARSEKLLAVLKDWMNQHNAVIISVLCLIIAAKLIGDAISSLTG